MAATTPTIEGEVGMSPSEWREEFGDRPEIIEERDLIARWLEDFLKRAIRDIESEQGERILNDLLARAEAQQEADKRKKST